MSVKTSVVSLHFKIFGCAIRTLVRMTKHKLTLVSLAYKDTK